MRTATPLNIETQPGVGMGYVIRNVKTKKLVRASTTCQRDIDRRGSKIKALRAFSGDEPFFTVKVGSLHTEIQVLKFLCGKSHKKCRDESGTFEWTGISLAEARKQKLEFSEPGYVTKEEVAPKAKKVKKTKVAKVAKVRKARVAKVKPTETVAEVTPTAPTATETVVEPVAEVVTPKVEESDAEFEADLQASFEADLKKAEAAAAAK